MKQTKLSSYTIDKFAKGCDKYGSKLLAKYRRSKLNNTDFSVISNNCWGGYIYRYFGLPYTSPTIGLYFFQPEYIELLSDLKHNLELPLEFISTTESKYGEELKRKNQINVPIGVLGGKIEIVFLHYHSEEEAKGKWERRVKRVNYDNLIVKDSEMNLCKLEHLVAFDKMSFQKKVLLVSKDYTELSDYTIVKRYSTDGDVRNDTIYYGNYTNIIELVNSRRIVYQGELNG